MYYTAKTTRSAYIVSPDGDTERLKRIPFMSGSYNEAWLQRLIAMHPALLPADDVGPEFTPLVCIGREVPVGSGETQGYIDNLYVTPSGHIVIVETKLFRNMESRRTVVAQIIDYAKELQKWDAEMLDAVARAYTCKELGQSFRIIDIMVKQGYLADSDGAELVDNLNKNLSSATFLLLIVGDGIRSGVQQLADFLNENMAMNFRLALAELELYQRGEDVIVIPHLLTRTTVIERFSFPEPKNTDRKRDERPRAPIASQKEFIEIFASRGGYDADLLAEFIADLDAIDGLSVGLAPTELTVRFSPNGSASFPLFTFCISMGHADLWVMPGRMKSFLERYGHFPSDADDFLDFFKEYVDVGRCKSKPYDRPEGFYFADVGRVLENATAIIAAAEQFASLATGI